MWSIASSLHSCLVWQSFSVTSVQVFFGLHLGLTPSISRSMHFFTQSFSSFLKTCPCHLNLCRCSTVIISYIPNLLLEPVCYFNVTQPIIILISACWSVNSFSLFTGHVSLPCNIQLRTQLVYKTSLLVSRDTSCLNLCHPLRNLGSTAASASPSTLNMLPR